LGLLITLGFVDLYRSLEPIAMSTPSPTPSGEKMLPGSKDLQEKLHQLLTKLSGTIELIKTWPESDGDDASIHVQTTTKLIAAILEVIEGLKNVEGVVKADTDLRKSLQGCPVPINLLDLLDHGGGLNPDCFSRGLLRESLGQLKGLRRRKLALKMLGEAVHSGLQNKDSALGNDSKPDNSLNKRKREGEEKEEKDEKAIETSEEPVFKKARTDAEESATPSA
jgi:hypothetical protein